MSGIVITNSGRKILLNRCFKSSADYLPVTLLDIGTGTTDPLVTNTALETPLSLNKSFVSGYPLLDETNMQATIRALVLTTESNGNSVTEACVKNIDASPLMMSRLVHTAVSKSATVQMIYVWKFKIS